MTLLERSAPAPTFATPGLADTNCDCAASAKGSANSDLDNERRERFTLDIKISFASRGKSSSRKNDYTTWRKKKSQNEITNNCPVQEIILKPPTLRSSTILT